MTAAPALGVRCIVAASRSPKKLAMLRGEHVANMTPNLVNNSWAKPSKLFRGLQDLVRGERR
jgi:hypothetical protein